MGQDAAAAESADNQDKLSETALAIVQSCDFDTLEDLIAYYNDHDLQLALLLGQGCAIVYTQESRCWFLKGTELILASRYAEAEAALGQALALSKSGDPRHKRISDQLVTAHRSRRYSEIFGW